MAASKLNLPPTEQWVDHELNGYDGAGVPHRDLIGTPKALSPRQGWIPIILGRRELDEMLASCSVRESVASLESLIERSDGSSVLFPIPPGLIMEINNLTGESFGTMSVHLSITQIHGLLDAVRNLVLEWALRLERAGISGEGMSFNKEEKQLADAASNTFNIGSIGSIGRKLRFAKQLRGHYSVDGDLGRSSEELGQSTAAAPSCFEGSGR